MYGGGCKFEELIVFRVEYLCPLSTQAVAMLQTWGPTLVRQEQVISTDEWSPETRIKLIQSFSAKLSIKQFFFLEPVHRQTLQ